MHIWTTHIHTQHNIYHTINNFLNNCRIFYIHFYFFLWCCCWFSIFIFFGYLWWAYGFIKQANKNIIIRNQAEKCAENVISSRYFLWVTERTEQQRTEPNVDMCVNLIIRFWSFSFVEYFGNTTTIHITFFCYWIL